jgi:hypothetical protein
LTRLLHLIALLLRARDEWRKRKLEENEMITIRTQQLMADTLDRIANTGTLNGAVPGASKKTVFGWMKTKNLTVTWMGQTRSFSEAVALALDQHRLLALPPKPLDPEDFIERAQLLRKLREKRAELARQQEQRQAMAAEAAAAAEIGSSKWLKQQEPQKPSQPQHDPRRASGRYDAEYLGSGREGVRPGGMCVVTAKGIHPRERAAMRRRVDF